MSPQATADQQAAPAPGQYAQPAYFPPQGQQPQQPPPGYAPQPQMDPNSPGQPMNQQMYPGQPQAYGTPLVSLTAQPAPVACPHCGHRGMTAVGYESGGFTQYVGSRKRCAHGIPLTPSPQPHGAALLLYRLPGLYPLLDRWPEGCAPQVRERESRLGVEPETEHRYVLTRPSAVLPSRRTTAAVAPRSTISLRLRRPHAKAVGVITSPWFRISTTFF